MQHRLIAFLLFFTGLPAPLLALETPAVDDVFTSTYNGGSSTNYGTHQHLFVSSSASFNRRTWIKFNVPKSNDLSFNYTYSILPTWISWEQVTKAVLRLWVDTVTTPGSIEVRTVNGTWAEKTLTHSNAASLISGLSAAHVTFPIDANNAHDYIDVDITELVRDWLDPNNGGITNYGLALVGVGSTNCYFDSKDDPDTGHGPSLHMVLTPARVHPRGDVTMGSFTTIPSGQTAP